MAPIPEEFHDLFETETFAHVATLTDTGLPTSHRSGSTTTRTTIGCWLTPNATARRRGTRNATPRSASA